MIQTNKNPMINIAKLDKAEVLAALFNNSKQQGLGILNGAGRNEMSKEDAAGILKSGSTYFDYLRGRVMKVDLRGDELDPWGYDRDNGSGAAEKALASLMQKVM